jgi:Protein of unknown function (DUF2752)
MTITATHHVETPPSRWRRVRPSLVLAGVVVALSVALHFRDPHESGSWGFCPWRVLTGTSCPGCGGLRAVNDLTRGDLQAAASSNLLFVSAIPFAAWLWLRSLSQRWRGVREPLPRGVLGVSSAVVVVLVVVFWVVRNLPSGAWLAP